MSKTLHKLGRMGVLVLALGMAVNVFAVTTAAPAIGVLRGSGLAPLFKDQRQALANAPQRVTGPAYHSSAKTRPQIKGKTRFAAASIPQTRRFQSTRAVSAFQIYDVNTRLLDDYDGDGYYSRFEMDIDVDVDQGFADVYAEIYYRAPGGSWQWLHTTDVFQIQGASSTDEYSLVMTLNSGFVPDQYDFAIDIYQSGYSDIVASDEPGDDVDLENIPLEDQAADALTTGSLSLNSLDMQLSGDADYDGFFTGFSLDLIATNNTFGRNLEAVLYSRDSSTGWYRETSTAAVWANPGDQMIFTIDADWSVGYLTDYYDFLVEIIDPDRDEVVAQFGPEYQALSQRPLESADHDPVSSGDTTVITVDESSAGGSLGVWMLVLFMLASLSLRARRCQGEKNKGSRVS